MALRPYKDEIPQAKTHATQKDGTPEGVPFVFINTSLSNNAD